jgi:hypothetical protein
MSEMLTAKECGVTKWCETPHTVSIFFKSSAGPNVMCTCIDYTDTLSEVYELAKTSFFEAFRHTLGETLTRDIPFVSTLGRITVSSYGYGDQYDCFFTGKEQNPNPVCSLPKHIECRIIRSEDWHLLSSWEKSLKWACDLETHLMTIIIQNKVRV